MNKRNIIITLTLILLLFIGIGYAYLETDLKINTSIHLKKSPITKPEKNSFAEYIVNLAGKSNKNCSTDIIENTSLAYDCTIDDNLRYVGANPNNYVSFNNQLWRIIGVMNNIDDETGKKKSLIKIISTNSITGIAYDTTTQVNSDGTWGNSDWTQADIMKLLNPGYENELINNSLWYNSKSGECYQNNNTHISCDFTNIGLKEDYKKYIQEVKFNLGNVNIQTFNGKINNIYNAEKDTSYTYKPTSWIGKIGLPYISDFYYATSGSEKYSKNECLEATAQYYANSETWGKTYTSCYDNDWFSTYQRIWTMIANRTELNQVFNVWSKTNNDYIGGLDYNTCCNGYTTHYFYPSLYLKSSVKITSGTGSQNDPYQISLD